MNEYNVSCWKYLKNRNITLNKLNSSSFEAKVLNSYLLHNLYLIKTENVIKSILILSAGA